MNSEEKGMWDKIRDKGFIYYFISVASLTLVLLTLADLIIDTFIFGESVEIKNYVGWNIPINLTISCLFAIWKWFFKGKRLELKSDVIEMNLNEENGKKEK